MRTFLHSFRVPLILAFSFLLSAGQFAQGDPTKTAPVDGLRENVPAVFAIRAAKVVIAPGKAIEPCTIVVRDGVITDVGSKIDIPADARVYDLQGKTIYPGFIDSFTEESIDAASLKDGAPHWNSEVRAQLSVAQRLRDGTDTNEQLRKQGIIARLVAPSGGIIKGTSALISTGKHSSSHAILKADIAQHMRLTVARGRSREEYPNSPMGAVALARQALYDADWYHKAWTAHRANKSVRRPERNDALEVLQHLASDHVPVVIDTSNELFVLRADRFAREFGLNLIVRGSGNEYRRLDAIRRTGRTIIVPLDFPKPPNVATTEAALNVSLEAMMHWDIAPENPGRLEKAGVQIVLTSDGLKADKFWPAARRAVQRGLSREGALKALTTAPAELFGVADRLGTIESGKDANFVVASGDIFDAKTKVNETWIDGRRYQFDRPPEYDLVATWKLTFDQPLADRKELFIEVNGEPGKLTGTARPSLEKDEDGESIKLAKTGLRGARFSCSFEGKELKQEGTVRLSAVLEITPEKQTSWQGTIDWPGGSQTTYTAIRTKDSATDDKAKDSENKPAEEKEKPQAVNYPLGAFGRSSSPEKSAAVLLTGATVWTCGKQGVLKDASVLIRDGKIAAIGTNLDVPSDVKRIDVKGSHISPGIIDCHSHMATDGGVNEGTQAITAEVRIGDFVDCDDITIYRQLAGGVTCANILHGSANPIGGQNQVIKLRWGGLSEEFKFAAAPQGIKFALGENVKQSNWGDEYTTRYPQTRMGVEQIMRDAFLAARGYQERWADWEKNHQGLPPRRDLELDAVSEILQGKRWIHCHSYRQDEILALIRTLDNFHITIGSFQHILEGYKVADAMAKHGATGSAFSDWWAYKFEVYDAIPYNGALMHSAGVNVSFNSDDRELARHLNHEAAKAVKYGGVDPLDALKFVTLNPAKQLRIDEHVGSLEVGKDADLVVWSGPPLSILSRCQQTWIDGQKYFDVEEDRQLRQQRDQMRIALVQKILKSGEAMNKPGGDKIDPANLWPREDIFCHHHGHGQ